MNDQENIKRLQKRDIDPEWEEIYREMAEGSGNEKPKPIKLRSSMEIWAEEYPDLLFLEPREFFDEAIVGVVERINLTAFCYDTQEILDILNRDHDLTPEEALEYFEFNIRGSYVGEHSPVFLDRKVDL